MDITDKSYSTVLQTQDMRFAASSTTGRNLALWKYVSADKSELYIYDFETKSLDKVAPEKGSAVSVPQFFDAGQDVLYYLTNEGSRVLSLVKYDVQKKLRAPAYNAGQQIVFARQSSNQRYFVIGVRQGDRLISRLFDTAWIEVPISQPGLILDVSPSGRYMLYTTSGEARANDLQLYNLETKKFRKILPS
jgi:Tol biopolymer transport system component